MRLKLFGHYMHPALVLLWLSEAAAIFVTYWLVCCVLRGIFGGPESAYVVVPSLIFGLCVTISMVSMGLFSRRLRDGISGVTLRITLSVIAGTVLNGIFILLEPHKTLTLVQHLLAVLSVWVVLLVLRLGAIRLIDEDLFKRRVLVYGAGMNAARILRLRRRSDQRGFKLLGFVPATNEAREVVDPRLIEPLEPLHDIAQRLEIDEIVVAMDDRRQHFPLKPLLDCRLAGIEVTELVTFLERETGKVFLDILNPGWMIFSEGFRRDIMRRYSERAFDLAASFGLLVVAAPFMLLTALAIKLEEGIRAPVLYGQPRVGYAGRVFKVLKLRSMRIDAEKDGKARWAETNDNRITRVGSFIRKTRIDELPQLLNVFRGQMSFVGPRPERPEFVQQLAETIPYYHERHSIKPGITGWAQLCYPYGASHQDAIEKLQYDLYYVKNHGLIFDILILLQTVEVIVLDKGAR